MDIIIIGHDADYEFKEECGDSLSRGQEVRRLDRGIVWCTSVSSSCVASCNNS